MKCTQCGNTNFIEGLGFPIRISESWNIDSTFKMFVCDECGHVEFFYSGAVNKNNEIKKLNKTYDDTTKRFKSELEFLTNLQKEMNQKVKSVYDNEVERLESILKDETIIVAEYKKAQEELENLKKFKLEQKLELAGLSLADYPDRRQIRTLQAEISKMEKVHENNIQQVNRKYNF